MGNAGVGIIIPTLNEEETLSRIVSEVSQFGRVIVIDDGSTDDSYKIAKSTGACVVRHDRNYGYDAALTSGFNKAADLALNMVVTIDADGQHTPNTIKTFIDLLRKDFDIVVGTRRGFPRPAERLFALYTSARFGIVDPLCGLKGYNMRVYRAAGFFSKHCLFGTELALFGAINRYQLAQVPIQTLERAGTPKIGNSLIANTKLLLALARLITLDLGRHFSRCRTEP